MTYTAKKPDSHGFIHFTREENETWNILITRQLQVVENRACDEFLEGLQKLNLPRDHVPQCVEVSKILQVATGWSVVPVEAIIPLKDFFSLLSKRQFPAASFIRVREELDYLKEPDIFHELFGHCPLLTHPVYADFLEWYGKTALHTHRAVQSILGRLFWFTIEFGLLQTAKGLRIYGGGILSSYTETVYALESTLPQRKPFDISTVLNTNYFYNEIQTCYFIMDDWVELFKLKTEETIRKAESVVKAAMPAHDFVIC